MRESATETKKRVTVISGSPHRGGATERAARMFLEGLQSKGDVEGEIVRLSDYNLGLCRGCKVCFNRGEDLCPLKDDRDLIIRKMEDSDGIVFASPNYSWHVSGVMKAFLDRLGFVFHRPRFHGKTATAIVVQGIFRGGQIRKYLEYCAGGLGFNVTKGSVHKTLEPMPDKALEEMKRSLAQHSRRFYDRLLRSQFPTPSFFGLMMFRMSRSGIRQNVSAEHPDYRHFLNKGWFESGFYYHVRLGVLRRAAGSLFDWAGAHMRTFKVAEEKKRPIETTHEAPK